MSTTYLLSVLLHIQMQLLVSWKHDNIFLCLGTISFSLARNNTILYFAFLLMQMTLIDVLYFTSYPLREQEGLIFKLILQQNTHKIHEFSP